MSRRVLVAAALALTRSVACDHGHPVKPPPTRVPPAPPPPPPQPPPPPGVVVEILVPSSDTAIALGDSVELGVRFQETGLPYAVPPTISFSDSSVLAVASHPAEFPNSSFSLWGIKVGQTVAKVTVANVSDSVLISITAPPPDLAGSPEYDVIDLGTLGGS